MKKYKIANFAIRKLNKGKLKVFTQIKIISFLKKYTVHLVKSLFIS